MIHSAARICSEIKWTVAVRSSATDKTGHAEIGANPRGPQGSPTAAAPCVERLARSTAARRAALLLGDSPFANRIVSYLSSGALAATLNHWSDITVRRHWITHCAAENNAPRRHR